MDFEPIELKDTAEMMTSPDYKERFKAEFYQLKIRKNKLSKMIEQYEAGTLPFKPTCPIDVLKGQYLNMWGYMHSLEVRAKIEGIEL